MIDEMSWNIRFLGLLYELGTMGMTIGEINLWKNSTSVRRERVVCPGRNFCYYLPATLYKSESLGIPKDIDYGCMPLQMVLLCNNEVARIAPLN